VHVASRSRSCSFSSFLEQAADERHFAVDIPRNLGGRRGRGVSRLPRENVAARFVRGKSELGTPGQRAKRIDLKGSGSKLHFEKVYTLKNHGEWRKIQVRAPNIPDTLIFDIRNIQRPESGRLTFDVFMSLDTHIEYEQQNWANGLRLYSGSATIDARVKLNLKCEVSTRLEKSGTVVPDMIVGLRVVDAHLGYDNLKTEHIAGVGGEAARVLGDAVKGGLDKWKPEMERELLARADEAIVKAGQSKEVRLSLSELLEGKGKK
jgi:hypothetical protein